jgi:capsular polysaccharide biosynthesis protein
MDMELKDYLAAVRRFWATWVGVTLLGVLAAVAFLQLSTPVYEASARVFVSSSSTGTSQIVGQRVKSYPDVAVSLAVLDPVIDQLGLESSFPEVRGLVRATNPVDTSQILIVTTGTDPQRAADLANAVATEFTQVVEELERPDGGPSPVSLTVTDPATPPIAPSSPTPLYVLALGSVVGLLLGLALAIVRSRTSTALFDEAGVRAAWGEDDGLRVLASPSGRARRSALAGRPASALARRLELMAEDRPLRLLLLSPAPTQTAYRAAVEFADEVVHELTLRDVTAASSDYDPDAPVQDARIRIDVGNPLAPLRVWRRAAEDCAGVVLVVPRSRVAAAELTEIRAILRIAGLRTLALVLTGHQRTRRSGAQAAPTKDASDVPFLETALRATSTARAADWESSAGNGKAATAIRTGTTS